MIRKYMLRSIAVTLLIIGCATSQPLETEKPTNTEKPKKVDVNTVISQLSQQISSTMLEQNKRRVAVMNFTLQTGEMTELGLYLSDKLTNSLFQYRDKFEVVERTRLESALKEMKLGLTGIIDDKTVQSIGKVLGADAIVIGSITDLGKEIDINVRMLGTEKANVLAVASAFLEKDNVIARLIGNVKITETASGKPIQPKAEVTTPSPKPESLPKGEVNDFIFEAKECKRKGQHRVLCTIAITNNLQKTRDLTIMKGKWWDGQKSIIVDDHGNQYALTELYFGATTAGIYEHSITHKVSPNLPMNLVLEYEEVISTAKHVNIVVDFWPDDYRSKYYKAVLRNIPLSR